MNVEHFLDTNIFVYMLDETDDRKRRRAEQLVKRSIETGTGCISYQVVQETLNVATRRLGFAADDSCTLLADVWCRCGRSIPARSLRAWPCVGATGTGFSFLRLDDSSLGAIQSGCVRPSTARTCSTASEFSL